MSWIITNSAINVYSWCKLIASYAETYAVKYKLILKHTHVTYQHPESIIQTVIKTIFFKNNNIIITAYSIIITLAFFVTGSSNVVTGETKSFFSVARSVSG